MKFYPATREVFGDEVDDYLDRLNDLCIKHLGSPLLECITCDSETEESVAPFKNLFNAAKSTVSISGPDDGIDFYETFLIIADDDTKLIGANWDGVYWVVKAK